MIYLWSIGKIHQKIVVISGGQNVDIMLVLIGFSEMRVFSQVSFLNELFEKSKGKKRTWANPEAQNSGNPCTKLIIPLFCLYMCFFVF